MAFPHWPLRRWAGLLAFVVLLLALHGVQALVRRMQRHPPLRPLPPGEVVPTSAEPKTAVAEPATAEPATKGDALRNLKLRLANLFAKGSWDLTFARIRKGYVKPLRSLLEDEELRQLAALVRADASGELHRDLADLYAELKAEPRYLVLAVLALSGHPDVEGLMAAAFEPSAGSDAVSRAVCAWGLSVLRTESAVGILQREATLTAGQWDAIPLQYALANAGEEGLRRSVAMAEKLVADRSLALGRELRERRGFALQLVRDPSAAAELRRLMESHPSPEIVFMSAQSLLALKDPALVEAGLNVLGRENREPLRGELTLAFMYEGLYGTLSDLPQDVRTRTAAHLQSLPDALLPRPSLRLLSLMILDPAQYLPQIATILESSPPAGGGDREEWRSDYLTYLAVLSARGRGDARSMLENFVVGHDLEPPGAFLPSLRQAGSLSHPALFERLLQYVEADHEMGKSLALQSLALFGEAQRDEAAGRLDVQLQRSWIETDRLEILQAMGGFGARGRECLIRTTQARNPIDRLVAWSALSQLDGFAHDAALLGQARRYLANPALQGEMAASENPSALVGKYLSLFRAAYSGANSSDLPILQRMVSNPTLPFSAREDHLEEVRAAAQSCIEAIRLREGH